jgi:hypothetical protein
MEQWQDDEEAEDAHEEDWEHEGNLQQQPAQGSFSSNLPMGQMSHRD